MRGSVRTPVYQLTSAMKAAEAGAFTILSGPASPAKTTVARILLETAEKPTAHLVTDKPRILDRPLMPLAGQLDR